MPAQAIVLALLAAMTTANNVKIRNGCSYSVWINEVAPHANLHDSWSQLPPNGWWQASQPPVPGMAGVTEKIALSRGCTDVFQFEVAQNVDGYLHYDMSSVNGHPFWKEGRRLGCYPNWWDFDSQYCAPSQSDGECGKQVPGNPWKVMGAPASCGDIVLELCAEP
jgi:hypothetical protein